MEWKDRLLFAYDLQWFAKDGPGGEKTEPATEKKLREAREDGKVEGFYFVNWQWLFGSFLLCI